MAYLTNQNEACEIFASHDINHLETLQGYMPVARLQENSYELG